WCSTLGSSDFIRVPWPAARMIAARARLISQLPACPNPGAVLAQRRGRREAGPARQNSMNSGEFADATIVFDLDGTLVDTAPDLVRALNETLDLEGLPHVSQERVRRMVGYGARYTLERAAAVLGVTFSAERLDQLTKAFVDFYRA